MNMNMAVYTRIAPLVQRLSDVSRYILNWSFQNTKLRKHGIVSFNLPADKALGFKVCPKAGSCRNFCYAKSKRYLFKNVRLPREYNLRFLLDYCHNKGNDFSLFIEAVVYDIAQFPKTKKRIRIHDSGDFFCKEYFFAWLEIAKHYPDIYFYAYTKQVRLVNKYRDQLPHNFHVIQSFGGQEDKHIDKNFAHSAVFTTMTAMEKARYVNGTKSEIPALNRTVKIGLHFHGPHLTKTRKRQADKVVDLYVIGNAA